jgi:hypothetical protein
MGEHETDLEWDAAEAGDKCAGCERALIPGEVMLTGTNSCCGGCYVHLCAGCFGVAQRAFPVAAEPGDLIPAGWFWRGDAWHYFARGEAISACDWQRPRQKATTEAPAQSLCPICLAAAEQGAVVEAP